MHGNVLIRTNKKKCINFFVCSCFDLFLAYSGKIIEIGRRPNSVKNSVKKHPDSVRLLSPEYQPTSIVRLDD